MYLRVSLAAVAAALALPATAQQATQLPQEGSETIALPGITVETSKTPAAKIRAKREVKQVTAQKRPEAVKDVPVSLDAISGRSIEEANDVERAEVINGVPNAQMSNTVAGSAYAPFVGIRGVGSALLDTDPSVGMYVDGVSLGVTQAFSGGALDLDRVEVLRGPQGTLYGRNNLAGSINFVSNLPDPKRSSGELGVEYGRFESWRGFGYVNVPLGDSWAVRGAFSVSTNDGYTPDLANGETLNSLKDLHGRLSLSGNINERLSYVGSIEVEKLKPRDAALMYNSAFNAGSDSVDIVDPSRGDLETTIVRNHLTYRLDGGAQIVSVSGYVDNKTGFEGNIFPAGYFAATDAYYQSMGVAGFEYRTDSPFEGAYRQFSQELRYVSDTHQPLQWVGGVYVERSNMERTYGAASRLDPANMFFPGLDLLTIATTGHIQTTSIAGFIDGTYDLGGGWKLFGGVRVGYDWKDFDYSLSSNNLIAASMLGFGPPYLASSLEGKISAPYATPRIGLQYDVTKEMNVYTSISRGYKSGGFNSGFVQAGDDGEYASESLTSYELGWKSSFLDNRFRLNGSVFLLDWEDQQVVTFDAGPPAVTGIANAPKSRSIGGEIEGRYQLDEHWTLGFGAGYTDATYVDFTNAPSTPPMGVIDASGNRQQYVSRFTGSTSLAYMWNIGIDSLVGLASVNYQYRSGFYFDVANTLWQSGYGLLGARVGAENDKYAVYLWGENLTNERYRMSAFDYGPGELVTIGQPLTVGGTLKVKF